MNFVKVAPIFLLTFFFFVLPNVEASVDTSITQQVKENYMNANTHSSDNSIEDMRNEINDAKNSFQIKGSLEKIQSFAIPLLVATIIISAILFLVGWLVPPVRIKAWSLIGAGLLAYVLVMYPFNIVGGFMAGVEFIVNIFYEEG